MATCKDCLHYELCQYNAYQEAHYFGKDKKIYITIKNNSACKFFKPTADVAEVKHGYWFEVDSDVGWSVDGCSVCGEQHCFYEEENKANYCPDCGAKMDGKKEGTT
jgi:hypothetical protein